ncbi:MAG TPA: hypothetical protein VGL98_15305 [Gammaproteobacteria bacterium]
MTRRDHAEERAPPPARHGDRASPSDTCAPDLIAALENLVLFFDEGAE